MVTSEVILKFNKEIPAQIMKNLDAAMDDIADAILARSQELVPVDEATLKHSGHVESEEFDKKVIYDSPYAPFIEWGTRPHFPPYEPIRDWTWRNRSNLGISDKEVNGVAYQICLKIAREGTEPQPYMRPAFDEVSSRVGDIIRNRIK
jgi:HK97 gp10 family phage protein